MKFENIHIMCDSSEEVESVINIAMKIGYKIARSSDGYLNVVMNEDGYVFDSIFINSKVSITYQQFMEKYGMSDLKSKVEEAKTKLSLSSQELSVKLGHQKKYITNALRDSSVKRQKNIILKIDALLLKESGDLTHDFKGKALNKFIDDAMMISKSEYESMKKEIDHKNQVLDKRNALLENSIVKINELESQVQLLQKECLDFNEKINIPIWISIAILVVVVMLAFGVLHFNGVV